jgi:hypothetical protein
VLLSDLQILHYNLGGMHNVTPKIRGDMAFQKYLTLKLDSETSLETGSYSSVWTLETNTFRAQEFF